jgi:hypothetical protein
MKNIVNRYFKVSTGPVKDSAIEMTTANRASIKTYQAILEEIGADSTYWHRNHRLTGLSTDSQDLDMFRRAKGGGLYPKKNHKEGLKLHKRFEAVPIGSVGTVLKVAGNPRQIFSGMAIHAPTVTVLAYENEDDVIIIVNVPWYDEDPEVISKARSDVAQGMHCGKAAALLWEPVEGMVEIKHWEAIKLVDEFNNRKKVVTA